MMQHLRITEASYPGWQKSLALLAKLVEAEFRINVVRIRGS
jgi:hypothetical protein